MKPVIVGWGHSRFERQSASNLEELIQDVAREALAFCGLSGRDVDAAWLGHFGGGLVADSFCASLVLGADDGLRFKPAVRCENACASGSAALYAAADAIRSGRVRIALVVGAEKMSELKSSEVTRVLGGGSYQKEEAGLSFPAIFARFADAYRDRFGDPSEAMAHIAVKNHANALANPLAHMRQSLSLDHCLTVSSKNPEVAPPLKMTDCSLVSDGAAAIVLVAEDLLPDFKVAVGFRAMQHVSDVLPLSRKNLTAFEGPNRAIAKAYDEAALCVDDLSLAEVHDCFTIAELLMTEALGLAGPGEGRAAILDGETTRQGRLPINLSGGLKAKGHPIGATGVSMHVMAARQLTGTAGGIQLPGAELAMCVNMGGGAVATYASVLEPLKA